MFAPVMSRAALFVKVPFLYCKDVGCPLKMDRFEVEFMFRFVPLAAKLFPCATVPGLNDSRGTDLPVSISYM